MLDSRRKIAIVGAGSPRGKELRDVLEERGVASAGLRLLDEDISVGTLTRSGDEATLIAAVDEASFAEAGLVFFAGGAEMAERHARQALAAGAHVIDLSEDPGLGQAAPRIPALDPLLGRPEEAAAPESGAPVPKHGEGARLLRSPSAAAIVAASLAAAFARFDSARLAVTFLRPVSERGQEGIDELERQTVRLLSFQPVSEGLFGAQVAFNLMEAYGADAAPSLATVRGAIARDVARVIGSRAPMPALHVIQVPVFFSYGFTAYAALEAPAEIPAIEAALASAGLAVAPEQEPQPTSMSVIGRPEPVLGRVVRDGNREAGYWLWGAADNVRVVAANAAAIAEQLE